MKMIQSHPSSISKFSNLVFSLAHFIVLVELLIFNIQPVSSQDWDGVIVTQADYQALQAFKQDLIDPKGFLKSWNDSGFGACSGAWEGIKCAQGQVIVIQLPWRELSGRITNKIAQFQALRKLSLHNNLIGGSIPVGLGFLPNLRGVQLFNNRFSGSIPASLGLCRNLQTLDLANNSLTGNIPASLANSSKLFMLNVSFNSLSGSIPTSLMQSSSLKFLALQNNNLSGQISDSWTGSSGINVSHIQALTLDYNAFSGNIPTSLSKLIEIQVLTLSHNKISGPIPSEIGGLSKLKTLDFSFNYINGSLPSLSNLSSLAFLNLESNNLDNNITDSIGELQNLSVLNLRNNHFVGEVPDSIGKIVSLGKLDVAHNNLTGGIPVSLGDLPNLKSFNVSYNNLSGPVPILLSQKFNSSAFVGNLQLCGYSDSTLCPVSPTPSQEKTKSHGNKLSTKDIILIAAGALLVLLLLLCCILLCCLFRRRTESNAKDSEAATRAVPSTGDKQVPPTASEVEAGGSGGNGGKLVHFDGPIVFTAEDLLCATAEIMGKSTYGTVYKGTLEDGNQVAVKRLREKLTKNQKEFEKEVNVIGKIRHPNLLAMRAYYMGPKGEKLIVFDYMPKGSLATYLHARSPDTPIDWLTRMKIMQEIARGLLHLHNNANMIHGNLTSSNVVLDEHTNAKVADFGLSRLMTAAANSNVIATAGALGYRAPELSKIKKANRKTDVYSLGVIILELLTGKSPGEGADLPQWVASIVKEEWTNEVFDLELMKDASAIGDELHCVDPSPSSRPEVQEVLQQLEEIRTETTPTSGDEAAAGPSTAV